MVFMQLLHAVCPLLRQLQDAFSQIITTLRTNNTKINNC